MTLKMRLRKIDRMIAYMQNINGPYVVSIPENEKPIIRAHDTIYIIPAKAQREETSKVLEIVAFEAKATDERPINPSEAGKTFMLLALIIGDF